MNAYIASFMLLVFNAVGLAMPVTEAVAEEQVATNAKLPDTQSSNLTQNDVIANSEGDRCKSIQTNRLENTYHAMCSADRLPLISLTTRIGSDAGIAVAVGSSGKLKLKDNLHIEGAP